MNRYLLPLAAALIVAIGALYMLRPSSNVGPATTPSPAPATIDGTWSVSFTRQEMLDAGADPSEDNIDNYGAFHLTLQSGWWSMDHLSPIQVMGGTSTYTADGTTIHFYSPDDDVTFDVPYTVTATSLTFDLGGPVALRVKPWTRISTETITATPIPRDLAAYRVARNAVCEALTQASMPPDADPLTNPTGATDLLQAVIARANNEITQLSALNPPADLAAEHEASIQAIRDTVTLLQQEIDLLSQGKADQVAAVDQQTVPLSTQREQFEQKYGLAPCP